MEMTEAGRGRVESITAPVAGATPFLMEGRVEVLGRSSCLVLPGALLLRRQARPLPCYRSRRRSPPAASLASRSDVNSGSPADGGKAGRQGHVVSSEDTPGRTPLYRSILPEGPGALKRNDGLVVNKIR